MGFSDRTLLLFRFGKELSTLNDRPFFKLKDLAVREKNSEPFEKHSAEVSRYKRLDFRETCIKLRRGVLRYFDVYYRKSYTIVLSNCFKYFMSKI